MIVAYLKSTYSVSICLETHHLSQQISKRNSKGGPAEYRAGDLFGVSHVLRDMSPPLPTHTHTLSLAFMLLLDPIECPCICPPASYFLPPHSASPIYPISVSFQGFCVKNVKFGRIKEVNWKFLCRLNCIINFNNDATNIFV